MSSHVTHSPPYAHLCMCTCSCDFPLSKVDELDLGEADEDEMLLNLINAPSTQALSPPVVVGARSTPNVTVGTAAPTQQPQTALPGATAARQLQRGPQQPVQCASRASGVAPVAGVARSGAACSPGATGAGMGRVGTEEGPALGDALGTGVAKPGRASHTAGLGPALHSINESRAEAIPATQFGTASMPSLRQSRSMHVPATLAVLVDANTTGVSSLSFAQHSVASLSHSGTLNSVGGPSSSNAPSHSVTTCSKDSRGSAGEGSQLCHTLATSYACAV